MQSSGKTERAALFNCFAVARSRPNGFSTITRAFFARPAAPRFRITVSNIDATCVLDALRRAPVQALQAPVREGHADHRDDELATFNHRVERGKYLLIG